MISLNCHGHSGYLRPPEEEAILIEFFSSRIPRFLCLLSVCSRVRQVRTSALICGCSQSPCSSARGRYSLRSKSKSPRAFQRFPTFGMQKRLWQAAIHALSQTVSCIVPGPYGLLTGLPQVAGRREGNESEVPALSRPDGLLAVG